MGVDRLSGVNGPLNTTECLKQRNFQQGREGVQVADRRLWQSAMTSPIGDVGSERVKGNL